MAITVLNGINTKFGSDTCNGGDCSNEYRLKANARSKEKHVLDVSATRSVERNADPLEKYILRVASRRALMNAVICDWKTLWKCKNVRSIQKRIRG